MKIDGIRAAAIAASLGAILLAGILIGTQTGIGTLNDSAYYFSAANSLASGQGLRVEITPVELRIWSDNFAAWPPLYPVLLGFGVAAGMSVDGSARVVALSAVIGMYVGLLVLAYLLSGRWIVAVAVAILTITIRPVWGIVHYGLSEPLFMALSYGTLAVFAAAFAYEPDTPQRRKKLWAASLGLSLVMLTRYLGVAFFGAAIAAFLLDASKREAPWKAIRGGLIVLLCPMPLFAYLVRNWQLTGSFTDAQRLGYPNSLALLGREVLLGWLPTSPFHLGLTRFAEQGASWLVPGALVVLLMFAGAVGLKRENYAVHRWRAGFGASGNRVSVSAVIGLAVIAYGASVSALSARGSINPNDINRLLVPIWPLAFVLAVGWLSSVLHDVWLRRIGTIALVCFLVMQLVGVVQFSFAASTGLGFDAAPWKGSEALQSTEDRVTALNAPGQLALFSNLASGVWLRARAPVKRLDGPPDTWDVCNSLARLPSGSTGFALVLFSQVTPSVADNSWRMRFSERLTRCVSGKLDMLPVADGLIVTGLPPGDQ